MNTLMFLSLSIFVVHTNSQQKNEAICMRVQKNNCEDVTSATSTWNCLIPEVPSCTCHCYKTCLPEIIAIVQPGSNCNDCSCFKPTSPQSTCDCSSSCGWVKTKIFYLREKVRGTIVSEQLSKQIGLNKRNPPSIQSKHSSIQCKKFVIRS